jgi:hypothetical protein
MRAQPLELVGDELERLMAPRRPGVLRATQVLADVGGRLFDRLQEEGDVFV